MLPKLGGERLFREYVVYRLRIVFLTFDICLLFLLQECANLVWLTLTVQRVIWTLPVELSPVPDPKLLLTTNFIRMARLNSILP